MSQSKRRRMNDLSTMSEVQFNASLDALADGDAIVSSSRSTASSSSDPQQASPSTSASNVLDSLGDLDDKHVSSGGLPPPGQLPTSQGGVILPQLPTIPSATANLMPVLFSQQSQLSFPSSMSVSSVSVASEDAKGSRKRNIPVSEDEGEQERRRQDRNMREQQRSHQITHQISHLRQVLKQANIQFKPDKYSTLVSVVEYVQQLQQRASMLDSEHKKLVDVITKTSEIVNSQYVPVNGEPPLSDLLSDAEGEDPQDESMVFVQGIDYQSVFSCCPFAFCVASIDGRFLDCNKQFEQITGYQRQELLPLELEQDETTQNDNETTTPPKRNLSLFNVLIRDDMERVFMAMSEMLQRSDDNNKEMNSHNPEDYWTGNATLCRQEQEQVNVHLSLARTPHGRPRFFHCTVKHIT